MGSEFVEIIDFPNYQINRQGVIKGYHKRALKHQLDTRGYKKINLIVNKLEHSRQ